MWALTGDVHQDPDLPHSTQLMLAEEGEGVLSSILVSGPDPTRRRDLALAWLPLRTSLVVKDPLTTDHWSAAIRESTIANSNLIIELEEGLSEEGMRALSDATHLPLAILSEAPIDI